MNKTARVQRRNWSGSVEFRPSGRAYPESIEEIAATVKEVVARGTGIRVLGAGHSFSPLAATDGLHVSLERYRGLVSTDPEARTAVVRGGTWLYELGVQLAQAGLAQSNLGDIDRQSLAGAISTGTHGTGSALQTIAGQIRGITLVDGTGGVRTIGPENPDLLNAARISLGALGILAEITLSVEPAYKLHLESRRAELPEVLDQLEELKQHRHFEFFWFPYTSSVQLKLTDRTDQPVSRRGLGTWFNDVVIENAALWIVSVLSRTFPSWTPAICRITSASLGTVEKTDYSHRVFSTERRVRFNEMEYAIPAEALSDCVREVDTTIRRRGFPINFPVECRFVAADDIWLSPAYQRDSAYVAVHAFRGVPYEEYFRTMEAIFRSYGGRPHWGKIHYLSAPDIAASYPRFADFEALRRQFDPDGVFLTPYLRSLGFGAGE